MIEFIKKATDWILEKELEAANNCSIDLNDVEKQIVYLEEKKEKLRSDCNKNISEMEHILNRLHTIKANAIKCDTKE